MERRNPLLSEALFISATALGLLSLSFCGFSSSTKKRVLENYDNKCPDNGQSKGLQIHHRVEQCMGGSDREVNGVPLTPDIHHYWDAHTQQTGEVYPGIPITEAPPECFKNEEARRRIIFKYEHGLPLVENAVKYVVKSVRRHKEKIHKRKGKKGYRGQGKRR